MPNPLGHLRGSKRQSEMELPGRAKQSSLRPNFLQRIRSPRPQTACFTSDPLNHRSPDNSRSRRSRVARLIRGQTSALKRLRSHSSYSWAVSLVHHPCRHQRPLGSCRSRIRPTPIGGRPKVYSRMLRLIRVARATCSLRAAYGGGRTARVGDCNRGMTSDCTILHARSSQRQTPTSVGPGSLSLAR